MSKIIEKIIQIQTQDFLDKNGWLYKYQWGFHANFSTDSCLVQLTDYILRGIDKGFYTEMILVDLQKTFDTLDHTVLLQKCHVLVLRSQSLNGFSHVSQTESFFVTLEIVFSYVRLINCGVPQGSTLGLLLFLIYINNLPQTLNETGSYLYTDDSCIFYQDKDVQK